MKAKVYLETSVISYLTAKPSRDLIISAHQQLTLEWWDTDRLKFEVYISDLLAREAKDGDADAVQKRLTVIHDLPTLETNDQVKGLAQALLHKKAIPHKAVEDALHIALASIYRMDYLLTWNFKHIANIQLRKKMQEVVETNGYPLPLICTPEELKGR